MIGLDTNVLVRYLAQDDPAQSRRATNLMENLLGADKPGFIGLIVLVETIWVLQRAYNATRDEVRETITDLLECRHLVFEQRDVVTQALTAAGKSDCGLADALIARGALDAGCSTVYTFDRGATRVGMTLLEDTS